MDIIAGWGGRAERPQPGNRFVSSVRARGVVVRWKCASKVMLRVFPFPFCQPACPFSLETHPFSLETPTLLPQAAIQLRLALSVQYIQHTQYILYTCVPEF